MAEKKSAEEKLERLAELNRARVKKYREAHASEQKQLYILLSTEKYNALVEKLKQRDMTQKQFFEDAVDRFLANKDYEDIQYF